MNRYNTRALQAGVLWLALCVAPACSEPVADKSHFPTGLSGLFSPAFPRLWYSKHLVAMGEPALFQADDQAPEVYRFLWLRTFHWPVALRLQNTGDLKTLVVKQLNRAGGYEPGVLTVNQEIEIGAREWDTFVRLLDGANYWHLATNKEVMGTDGAQWILEAVKDGQYHVVDRWSPHERYSSEEDLKFRDACLYLLELSDLEVQPVY